LYNDFNDKFLLGYVIDFLSFDLMVLCMVNHHLNFQNLKKNQQCPNFNKFVQINKDQIHRLCWLFIIVEVSSSIE